MDECREAFEKWYKETTDVQPGELDRTSTGYNWIGVDSDWDVWYAAWIATKEQTIRHAYNAGVAWAIGNGKDIDEYLEAQK